MLARLAAALAVAVLGALAAGCGAPTQPSATTTTVISEGGVLMAPVEAREQGLGSQVTENGPWGVRLRVGDRIVCDHTTATGGIARCVMGPLLWGPEIRSVNEFWEGTRNYSPAECVPYTGPLAGPGGPDRSCAVTVISLEGISDNLRDHMDWHTALATATQ